MQDDGRTHVHVGRARRGTGSDSSESPTGGAGGPAAAECEREKLEGVETLPSSTVTGSVAAHHIRGDNLNPADLDGTPCSWTPSESVRTVDFGPR